MTIELKAGEVKVLNVALTPIAGPPSIIIDELFIGTRPYGYKTSADDALYIRIKNTGQGTVSGVLNIYDWQAWWEQEPGDDRRWKRPVFTLAPGEVFRYKCTWSHLAGDTTYVRAEVVVNNVIIAQTPRIYIVPGKYYTGPGKTAQGQCTYKAPGLAVLWYSQDSECNTWDGNIKTPEFRPWLHYVSWGPWRTGNYGSTVWWPAVFVPIINPNIIPRATYYAYISGGGAGAAWREVWFNFITA